MKKLRKIYFEIPGEPKGKGRPRSTKRGITYTPKETVEYENWVRMCYGSAGGEMFGEGPLEVNINCYYGIPKSYSMKKRNAALEGILRPTKKPDMDNVAKVVLDSLNGIAYKDDSQIIGLTIQKFFDNVPRLEVEIYE